VTTSLDESGPSDDPLAGNPLLQLSSRERQVLKLMAEGKSNPEIASILTIRLNTVHTYLKRIRHKLDIQNIAGLTAFARNNGLLD
jgi:DNA-binding CsgD family transcriptional regulator